MARIQLLGKLFIEGDIETITGLHIGGAQTGMEIGGVDNIVVRDPLTNLPYIPGSSLKGKMRSLMERKLGVALNRSIGQQVRIHECGAEHKEHESWVPYAREYQKCPICRIFGVAGERPFATPTCLYVRDARLSGESKEKLEKEGLALELPYTEVKWEAAIDRITSAAVPRQFERVPAGTVFRPVVMVFNFYRGEVSWTEEEAQGQEKSSVERSFSLSLEDNIALLKKVFEAMELLEDDYIGGMGSRGYGQVAFRNLSLSLKTQEHYLDPTVSPVDLGEFSDLKELRGKEGEIIEKVKETLKVSEEEHAPSEA